MVKPVKLGNNTRMTFSKINEVIDMPNLIEIQKSSYNWFITDGLREIFTDMSPIEDFNQSLSLEFVDFQIYWLHLGMEDEQLPVGGDGDVDLHDVRALIQRDLVRLHRVARDVAAADASVRREQDMVFCRFSYHCDAPFLVLL